MIETADADLEQLRTAADAAIAAAALCVFLANLPDPWPDELILAGSDQLPPPVLQIIVDAQKAATAAAKLVLMKSDPGVDWKLVSTLLVRMSIEARRGR